MINIMLTFLDNILLTFDVYPEICESMFTQHPIVFKYIKYRFKIKVQHITVMRLVLHQILINLEPGINGLVQCKEIVFYYVLNGDNLVTVNDNIN